MKRTITMTEQEIDRGKLMQMAEEKRITQREGAKRLGISERHFRRLLQRYRQGGDQGLISGHRLKPSNNRMDAEKRNEILDLLLTTYEGFGPTLASEKLEEREGIRVSKETVRQILIEEGKHRAKTKKKERAHPLRKRRARRGELVQIDGSYHAWLETGVGRTVNGRADSNRLSPEWGSRRGEIAHAKQLYEAEIAAECQTGGTPIKTRRVVYELNQVFGKNTILVNENGSQGLWSYYSPYYKVLERDGVVAPGEQTCMGGGVMGTVGAKLARPEINMVCLTGDGAFQMYNQDVPTAVQDGAPVTRVILNTSSLGWTKYSQQLLGERYIAVDFETRPDFVAMARAFHCHGERVEDPSQIRPALERALQTNHNGKPAILDVVVDPDDHPEGFVEFKHLKNEPRKKYL